MRTDNDATTDQEHDEIQVLPDKPKAPDGGYVLPLVHVRMPETVVNAGFWGTLGGAALVGAVDPPLAALIGAGVVIARHRHGSGASGGAR